MACVHGCDNPDYCEFCNAASEVVNCRAEIAALKAKITALNLWIDNFIKQGEDYAK